MTRLEANQQIVNRIAKMVEKFPDWRFHQLLQNLGVETRQGGDLWYEESEQTLSKMNPTFS